ncbi:MAG: RidA family protein [Alphaproteobacteria bacterium]|nr:RidA family protein [Alphaproteobacteria bacterium]
MLGRIDARLNELSIALPAAPAAVANYVPWVRTGSLVFVSGQVAMQDGKPGPKGKLGRELTVDQGAAAARTCCLSLLAQLKAACDGDLDRVVRCVKLIGFVASTEDFADHSKVVNGASDLMVAVFGDAGRHARSSVGVYTLPMGVAVEVEGTFEVK